MTRNMIQYEAGVLIRSEFGGADVLRAFLLAAGFDLVKMVEQESRDGIRISFYFDRRLDAEKMCARLRAIQLNGARVFLMKHEEEEWVSRWKEGWKPFPLTKRFQVVPLWQPDRRIPKGREPIYLETTNAFGTGLHETTRFTSEIIEGMAGRFKSFLDIGTGTGILAIVALKCGATCVRAFDIDQGAVCVARDNLKANQIDCQVTRSDLRTFRLTQRYDLVAANLVSSDLIEFRDRIVSFVCPGGWLVVSGILLKNLTRVRKAFSGHGLKMERSIRGREWAALLFRIWGEGR